MPSLRSTTYSPSVRSSPYRSSLSSSSTSLGTRHSSNGHRRSTGSETSTRRVLADIEWWKVVDGQREVDSDLDPDSPDRDNDDEQPFSHVLHDITTATPILYSGTATGVERPSTPLHWLAHPLESPQTPPALPIDQFSMLSITPITPTRRNRTLESSSSSLESTPEAIEFPLEFSPLFLDHDLPLLPKFTRRPTHGRPPRTTRAHTFSDFSSLFSNASASAHGDYADFSLSPFSSLLPGLVN